MTGVPYRDSTTPPQEGRRVFWPRDDLPSGRLTIWRGDMAKGVREVEYVPCSEAEALAEALEMCERETWIGDPLSSYLAKVLLEYRERHPKETP